MADDLERMEHIFFGEGDHSIWMPLMKEYERRSMFIKMLYVCQDTILKRNLAKLYLDRFDYQFTTSHGNRVARKLPNNLEFHFSKSTSKLYLQIYHTPDDFYIPLLTINHALLVCDLFDFLKSRENLTRSNKRYLQFMISDFRKHKKFANSVSSYFSYDKEDRTAYMDFICGSNLTSDFYYCISGNYTVPHSLSRFIDQSSSCRDELTTYLSNKIVGYYLGDS